MRFLPIALLLLWPEPSRSFHHLQRHLIGKNSLDIRTTSSSRVSSATELHQSPSRLQAAVGTNVRESSINSKFRAYLKRSQILQSVILKLLWRTGLLPSSITCESWPCCNLCYANRLLLLFSSASIWYKSSTLPFITIHIHRYERYRSFNKPFCCLSTM